MRWEIRVRPRPNADKSLGNEQSSQQDSPCVPRRGSRETNLVWLCVINFNRGMFYVSLFIGHCISILTESSIKLFVTSHYNDKGILFSISIKNHYLLQSYLQGWLLWYQSDVLWCNSILSESCLVSTNKLAWLRPPRSPDPRLWYGALSSGNEIINIILASRGDSLWKNYRYVLLQNRLVRGFDGDFCRKETICKKQFATNGQYVLTFMAFRSWHEWKANPDCIPASAWLPINPPWPEVNN